jgi:hypothetical protein
LISKKLKINAERHKVGFVVTMEVIRPSLDSERKVYFELQSRKDGAAAGY